VCYQFFINFINCLSALSTFFNFINFLSTFYQLFINFINFLSTFLSIFITNNLWKFKSKVLPLQDPIMHTNISRARKMQKKHGFQTRR